jgi:membrane protease YdiL (CAAX protease family)
MWRLVKNPGSWIEPMTSSSVLQWSHYFLILVFNAYLTGSTVCIGWALWRLARGRRIWPEEPLVARGSMRWGLGTIALLVLLGYGVFPTVVTELYVRVSGRDIRAEAMEKPAGERKGAEKPVDGGRKGAVAVAEPLTRSEQLTLFAIGNLALLLLLPAILRVQSERPMADLGLSLHRWQTQAKYGVTAALVAIPAVYALLAAVIGLTKQFGIEPTKHRVEEMLEQQFSVGTVILTLVMTNVLAPIVEEILFRGLLQRWLIKMFNLGSIGPRVRGPVSGELAASRDVVGAPNEVAESGETGEYKNRDVAPTDAGVVADGGRPTVPDRPADSGRYRSGGAILLTSLLFATVHYSHWPAPFPLFLLALGLGFLYERTGSLLAAMVMHGTFNSLGTVVMFLQIVDDLAKGH